MSFKIEALDTTRHRRAEFVCEAPELTEFVQRRARKEMQARASACFVLVDDSDPGRIIGYYTLSQTSVIVEQLPEAVLKKLPHYPSLGATLIGRLARDITWKGKNAGELLLVDALRRSVRHSGEIGAVAVVTDPKDEKASAFYAKFGFLPLNEKRMFIPMSELLARDAEGWNRKS